MKIFTKCSDYFNDSRIKFLLVMRFSITFILCVVFSFNAHCYPQQIKLDRNSTSIEEIFKQIHRQTGLDILWQPDQLNIKRKVDIQSNNLSITEILKFCFSDQNLEYVIHDGTIVIKRKTNPANFQQDSVIYRGKLTDEHNKPMAGVTVRIAGKSKATFTDAKGNFSILSSKKATLEFTYIGYQGKQLTLTGLDPGQPLIVSLVPGNNNLGEVNIVSTGIQDIPKERATGSFEIITKEQLQHSSDPNLLRRLEGITTSMNFNNNMLPIAASQNVTYQGQLDQSPLTKLTIRGRNTLNDQLSANANSSGLVLVVIDGVPSPYPIDRVNPNDVEDINILKDASAASIWGARAANGVIVIRTKSGGYSQPVNVSFNTNFNIQDKIDLFSKKMMSVSDYIDAQVAVFNRNNPNIAVPSLNILQPFISPVAEILVKKKNGSITDADATSQINALRNFDVRRDFDKYIFRSALQQAYSVSVDGGSQKLKYRFAVNYNRNRGNNIGYDGNTLSLIYNVSAKVFKNLELTSNITYSRGFNKSPSARNAVTGALNTYYFPYTRLADDSGTPLEIPFQYRPAFVDLLKSRFGSNILNMQYKPLEDMNQGYGKVLSHNLNFNLGLKYDFNNTLSASVLYNLSLGDGKTSMFNSIDSYFMRDQINYFTNPSGFVRQLPEGGRLDVSDQTNTNQNLRGQVTFNKTWNENHNLNASAGMDAIQASTFMKNYLYYGYNENTLQANNTANYTGFLRTLYANAFGQTSSRLNTISNFFTDSRYRTISSFAVAAYSYKQRYTLSGSVRRDLDSRFGSGTNIGGAPFASVGAKWNMGAENFYHLAFLPNLQLRTTFGYMGNVNPTTSSRPIFLNATYTNRDEFTQLPTADLNPDYPTNTKYRPEKTGLLNIGVDFGFKNNFLTGSIEYYDKHTKDLIAGNPLDLSTGFEDAQYNTADLHGWGSDLTLASKNLNIGLFSWTSNFLLSYNRVKVSKIYTSGVLTTGSNYIPGYDLSKVFGFKWAGLDALNGNPLGYYNGQPIIISDASSGSLILNQPISEAHYFGTGVPVYSGSFRNTFRYGAFTLSANILFKFKYYFTTNASNTLTYSTLYTGTNTFQPIIYNERWRQPGDEKTTNVPSGIIPGDIYRDLFWSGNEINVLKGDHIRLQEINFGYFLGKRNGLLKNPRIYCNISDLGIIWRANRLGLDPEVYDYQRPKTYAFGFSANF